LYYQPLEIGNLRIEGNLFAAPMAGYTDCITRSIALRAGASLAYTEMISAEALIRDSGRTISMMRRAAGEKILAVQLFGSSPEVLGRAAAAAVENGADLLDLNAGCPVHKVVRKGAGAALGRDIPKLRRTIRSMASAGLPVTVKLRSGWDDDELNWQQAALCAVEEGIAAIGFHPRTRSLGYGGKADWKLLKEMTEIVPVPVIGSGDLDSPASVLRMLKETGCRAVMIARGAVGNPEIFTRTRQLLIHGLLSDPPAPEIRLKNALNHLSAAAGTFGEEAAVRDMKKHLAAYVRGWPSASEMRNSLMKAADLSTMVRILSR